MKLDQHFMIDEDLSKRIVDYANISPKEKVLEIGPGKGALTKYLVKKANITAVEIDSELCKELKSLKLKNIKIVNDNVLNFSGDFDIIVSNLPYNICEPYFNVLIKKEFKRGIFCVPISFADRLIREKSLLSLIMPLFFKIKILEVVPKTAFLPVPKVDSAIISIEKRAYNTEKNQIVKDIYLQSDKKLKGAIQETYCIVNKLTKKEAKEKIPNLKFLEKRVYTLNYGEWKELISRL